MLPAEINQRRAAIRLQKKKLAALTGLDEMTVVRALSGKRRSYNETIQKLEQALIAFEQRELVRLAALHALPRERAA